MAEDLLEARKCGEEFTEAGMPFSKLSEALTFCETDRERYAFLAGVIEGPPLTEQEEKDFSEWMQTWSPGDAWEMLPGYISNREKRALVAEMQELTEEEETVDG